jgi:carboxyl-terminal processing protease
VIVRLCAFLCVLTIFAAIDQPASASEPRVALVIGNSEYGPAIGKLKNPANDAKLMAETLKGLGFKVDLVLDADQKVMKRAVKSFGAKLREAGSETTGLFYYAGHGVQVQGTNFLLPVGAEIEAEADVEIESIAADDVMTQMQSAGNAVNLVFLDACRNNPLARTSRSATRGLARLDAPRGSFVGYSTAPGDVAADGDGANSPYALALVDELKTPGISIEEAHRNVRAKVLAESGEKQTPWDSSSLTGSVVLMAKAAEPAPQPAVEPAPQPQVQQQAAIDKEALFWESIKASKDPAEYEAYLQQYPQGSFAPLAKAKIAALRQATGAAQSGQPMPDIGAASGSGQAAKLVVPASVKAEIDQYLRNLTSDHWALAISRDGSRAEKFRCGQISSAICWGGQTQEKANREAIKNCGGASACMLLYEGNRNVANVEIVTQSSAALAPQPSSEPSPESIGKADVAAATSNVGDETAEAGTFTVSKDVKAKIDQYLGKAAGGAGAWVFAISKDGTAGAYAHCGNASSVGCQHLSNAEISARKAAMHNCGGAGKCIILYEGIKKVVSGEIVVQ